MKTVIVTGAGGLIGSESVEFFCDKGFNVVGIDNDKRAYFRDFLQKRVLTLTSKWGEMLKNR